MIFVPTRKIGEALEKYLRDRGLETPFYHSQLSLRMGAGATRKKICRREPTNCGSDYLHQRFRDGARRFGCPNGYSLAASVVSRRLPYRSSVERGATGSQPSPSFCMMLGAVEAMMLNS